MALPHRQLNMWVPCVLYNQRDFPYYYSCVLANGSQTMSWATLAARVPPGCNTPEAASGNLRWCPPSGGKQRAGSRPADGDDDGASEESPADLRGDAFEEAEEFPCEEWNDYEDVFIDPRLAQARVNDKTEDGEVTPALATTPSAASVTAEDNEEGEATPAPTRAPAAASATPTTAPPT
eukprot:3137435-Prymnesium_polylepis.2